jgi:tungstate transport system substrate-binding protein
VIKLSGISIGLKGLTLLAIILVSTILTLTYYAHQGSQREVVVVGVPTTLYNTGLAQRLLESFKSNLGYEVEFKYVDRGTGDLLRLLADGSVCLAFTHSPLLERRYAEEGKIDWHGVFAYNYFIIVGPREDPVGVSKASNVIEAFKRIFDGGERGVAVFVSRGDLSGTHVRELQIWSLAGLNPEGRRWYLRTSQGAPETLITASNLKAYTFVDEGTFKELKSRGKVGNLEVLFTQDTYLLVNVYSIVTSKHDRCKGGHLGELLKSIVEYVLGEGRDVLEREYAVKGLFYPARGRPELLEIWRQLSVMEIRQGG